MRTNDGEQNVWRQAVGAFRNAVNALSGAAPGAFAGIISAERLLTFISPDLPLVEFTPFEKLPGALIDSMGKHSHGTNEGGTGKSHLNKGESVAAEPGLSRSHHPRRSHKPAQPREDGRHPPRPPFNSLHRQGARAGYSRSPAGPIRQTTTDGAADKRGTGSMAASKDRRGSSEALKLPVSISSPGPSPPEGGRREIDPGMVPDHEAGARSIPDVEPLQAISMLDDLAGAVLRQAGGSVAGPIPAADDLRHPGERAKPSGSERRAGGAGNGTAEKRGQQIPRVETHHGALSSGAAALIDSLAGHLFSSGKDSAGNNLRFGGNAHEKTAGSVPVEAVERSRTNGIEDHLYHPPSPPPFIEKTYYHPSDQARALPVDQKDETSPSGGGINADAIAMLVNDVLVSQARRHGVDLS